MNEGDALPAERGSVRPVTIEGNDRSFTCEVRSFPSTGLRIGAIVWVEFGATWPEINGRKQKQEGQWYQCVVLASAANTASGVHVRLSPGLGKAPEIFG